MARFGKLLKLVRISLSSTYAMKVANDYWQNTTLTHTAMGEERFDFYYNQLLKIIKPDKKDRILDYGGGGGEIAWRFKRDGFHIAHCDISERMIEKAREKYGLESCKCDNVVGRFDIIVFHNGFFYVHPKLQRNVLLRLFDLIRNGGRLYITDTPDFDKRGLVTNSKRGYILTALFPVYQVDLAGFFVKHKAVVKYAREIGFSVEKIDSWANYRSHWILTKIEDDNQAKVHAIL